MVQILGRRISSKKNAVPSLQMCITLLESAQKRVMYADADYQTCLIVAGIDTLDERREVLTAKFFKRHILASSLAQYYTAYSLIDETMTLLAACKIQNSFTQFEHVLISFVNRLYPLTYCLDNYT